MTSRLAIRVLERRTAALAYLLNGLFVIYGSVLMAHFAVVSLADLATKPATFVDYFFKSMSLDIAIAWADFFVGKALYESWRSPEATSRLAPSDALG